MSSKSGYSEDFNGHFNGFAGTDELLMDNGQSPTGN